MGEKRFLGLLRESFLLTGYIHEAQTFNSVNAACADRNRRIRIVRNLAILYATLHDAGLRHGDPSLDNFLVIPQPDGRDAIALIDLDGLRRRSGVTLIESAQDLGRLLKRGFIPRRERAWFIVTYSRTRRSPLNPRELLTLIGPRPARETLRKCALDENSRPAGKS